MIETILNFISACFAFLAAYFWWASAKVPLPEMFGDASWGDANDDSPTGEQLWARKTAIANRNGALCAALSALMMAAATLWPLVAQ